MTNTLPNIGVTLKEVDWLGRPVRAAGALALTLILSSCGSSGESNSASKTASSSSSSSSTAPTSGSSAPQPSGEPPKLIIGVHGGRIKTVFSYEGPGTSSEDRKQTGNKYPEGEGEPVECYVKNGRLVPSVPADGEPAGLHSTVWFKRNSAEQEWHPGLYSSNEAAVIQQSHACKPDEIPPYTVLG